jgi:protein-disulfide isomerase
LVIRSRRAKAAGDLTSVLCFDRRARGAAYGLAVALALGCALAASSAAAQNNGAPPPSLSGDLAAPPSLPDIVQGSADAPATIIEYASMTCSHCAAFYKGFWPTLKAKYIDPGKVKFILREFPLDPLAAAAFMLARCAGPEKRDAFLARLFDNQAKWAFAAKPLDELKAQVVEAGMSTADFEKCMANQDLFDHIKQARGIAATKLGVHSTPTFFVNGVRLSGEPSIEKFDEAMAPALR